MSSIDNYSNGSTGTLTENGVSVNYTVSSNANIHNKTHSSGEAGGQAIMSGATDGVATVSFDQEITGVEVSISHLQLLNNGTTTSADEVAIFINGAEANLKDLFLSGDVEFDPGESDAYIDDDGRIRSTTDYNSAGGPQGYSGIASLIINVPLTSVGLTSFDKSTGNDTFFDIGLSSTVQLAPCFTTGTLIDTDRGQVVVEDLKAGDKVRTLDHGFQPIRWVGHSRVMDAPIRIKAGTFDNTRDMVVSPRHRMLLQGWQIGLLFNHDEAFAAAYDMKNGDTISMEPEGWVDYYHILLDHHEVIYAEGAATESFYPDQASVNAMAKAAREDLQKHFTPETYGPTARPTLSANQAMYVGHNLDMLEDEPIQAQIQAAQ